MIVVGYPCVGKTTWAHKAGAENIIDLESSLFHKDYDMYVNVAIDIESQGYIVFVSSHPEVLRRLYKLQERYENRYLKVGILYPDQSLKETWIRRATNRYNRDPSDKNWNAVGRVKHYFDEDIKGLEEAIQKYEFTDFRIHKPVYRFAEAITFPRGEPNSVRREFKLIESYPEEGEDDESKDTSNEGTVSASTT